MWVTFGTTESGDDLKPLVWAYEPTKDQIEKEYRRLYPFEYEEVGGVQHRTLLGVEQG